MKLSFATASFLILCTTASAQTPQRHEADPSCKAAIEKICPGVKPGDGRIMECLKQHNTTFKQICPQDVGKHAQSSSQPGTPPIAAPVASLPAGQ